MIKFTNKVCNAINVDSIVETIIRVDFPSQSEFGSLEYCFSKII